MLETITLVGALAGLVTFAFTLGIAGCAGGRWRG